MRFAHVGVAGYNYELAVFETKELVNYRVAKFTGIVVFTASCSFKERQYLFVRN